MSRRKWNCLDCSVDTGKIGEHYMLLDEVWQLTKVGKVGMLCVGCCETRIGRELTPADFNDSHINRISPGFTKSQLLTKRIGL